MEKNPYMTEDLFKAATIIILTGKEPDNRVINEINEKIKRVSFMWNDRSQLPLQILKAGAKVEIDINELKKVHRKLLTEVMEIVRPRAKEKKENVK